MHRTRRKRGRGKKKGKWGKKERGGEKKKGKIDVVVLGHFSLMPSVVIARDIFLNFRVSARADQNPVRRTWLQKPRPPTPPDESKSCSLPVHEAVNHFADKANHFYELYGIALGSLTDQAIEQLNQWIMGLLRVGRGLVVSPHARAGCGED